MVSMATSTNPSPQPRETNKRDLRKERTGSKRDGGTPGALEREASR